MFGVSVAFWGCGWGSALMTGLGVAFWLEVRFASGGQRLPLRFGICGLLCVLRYPEWLATLCFLII